MRKISLSLLFLSASLLMGCQDYDPGLSINEITFHDAFHKSFSKIDPTHTWNFAEQQAVFVSPGSSQDVKIYAKTNGVYTLAGSFSGIDHAQWLNVDVVAGTKELMVSNGNRSIETFVGGEANFNGTRAANADGVEVTRNDGSNPYRFIDLAKATEFERLLPAGKDNRGRLTEDFLYVSRGPFMLYPQSWGAWANDKVGIYYYDANGIKQEVEIFALRGGDHVLEYQTKNSNGDLVFQALGNGDYISYRKFNNAPTGDGGSPDPNCTKERSKGFLVNVPEGMTFGIYVENPGESQKYYSEKHLNPTNQSHAVTFTMDGELYVAMEDDHTGSDYDINDIIVCFGPPVLPVIQDQDILKWVLCFEDLGNTFDIDYNDVVIGVTNPVDNKVTVTPLAAGGTLASYVFYNNDSNPVGSSNTDADDGEIHGMFGFPKSVSGQYTPINVSSDQKTFDTGISRQVNVGSNDYTLAPYAVGGTNANPGTTTNMGGFYVKVVPSGGEATASNATVNGQKIAPSTSHHIANGENVPYVFCVPHRWRDDDTQPFTYFRWSKEMVAMTTSYAISGHSFADWVGNKTQAQDWYRHPNEATTLTDHENHSYTPGGSDVDYPVNNQDHETNFCPSYEYEKCLINRDEIKTTSGTHESSTGVSAYELKIPKSDLHIVHHNEIGTDGQNHTEVVHDLTTYPSLNIAFVATGLKLSGDQLNLTLYREKGGTRTKIKDITIDYQSSKAIHGTADNGADYVDLHLKSAEIPSWNDVDNLVVEVAAHSADIHLNSIWVAMPHEDFHVMKQSEISTTLTSDNSEAKVALAFVGTANQHVMDYTTRNGYCSFSTYAVMLSQVENNGSKNSPTILFTLKRKSDGKYVLKNHSGLYLQAPTSEAVHTWTNNENLAAVLEFETCPQTSLMAGCTSGNDGDAVIMKTTVGETPYYLSATNKPAWWRTNPAANQKAIYLFHWEGSQH